MNDNWQYPSQLKLFIYYFFNKFDFQSFISYIAIGAIKCNVLIGKPKAFINDIRTKGKRDINSVETICF